MDVFPDATLANVTIGIGSTVLMLLLLVPTRKYLSILHRFFASCTLMVGLQTLLLLAQLLASPFLPGKQWIALMWIITCLVYTGFYLCRSQQTHVSITLATLLAWQLFVLVPLVERYLPHRPSWLVLLIAWCFISSIMLVPYCWLVQDLLLHISSYRGLRRIWSKVGTIQIIYGLVSSVGFDWLWTTHQFPTFLSALPWASGAQALLLILQAVLYRIIRQAQQRGAAARQMNWR